MEKEVFSKLLRLDDSGVFRNFVGLELRGLLRDSLRVGRRRMSKVFRLMFSIQFKQLSDDKVGFQIEIMLFR